MSTRNRPRARDETTVRYRGRRMLTEQQWDLIATYLDLSRREFQIIQSLFDDKTESQVALELGISVHTVHSHLERMYRKLDVHDRVAMVLRVFEAYIALESPDGNRGRISGI